MILILIGKSGSGKDFVMGELIKKHHYEKLIPVTNRSPRPRETHGIDYQFLTTEEFLKKIKSGEIFEHRVYQAIVNGNNKELYYGSIKQELNPDKNYITIVTPKACYDWINAYGKHNIQIMHIVLSDKIRENRACKRPGFELLEYKRRLSTDNEDFSKEVFEKLETYHGKPILEYDNSKEHI